MCKKTLKILSLDGGGIRSIIQTVLLQEIEKRTNKSISELFDLIVGTSTGATVALSLAIPDSKGKPKYTAKDMYDFFKKKSKKIYSISLKKKITSLFNLSDEKYISTGIDGVLSKHFKDVKLEDTLTEVFVSSYEIERRIEWFFCSKKAKMDESYNFLVKDVARASYATPTYFEAHKIVTSEEGTYNAFIDGSVFANNPAMCALAQAKSDYYNDFDDILMASIGTGTATKGFMYEKVKDWGLANWIKPIIGIMIDGGNKSVDFQVQKILGEDRYYRFQTDLRKASDYIDDISKENIRNLEITAETLINENQEKIDEMCAKLTDTVEEESSQEIS